MPSGKGQSEKVSFNESCCIKSRSPPVRALKSPQIKISPLDL